MNETSASFLNAEQAAQFLGGLNSRTVTRWSREGYLPAYPLGEGQKKNLEISQRRSGCVDVGTSTWGLRCILNPTAGECTLPIATDAPIEDYLNDRMRTFSKWKLNFSEEQNQARHLVPSFL
jgi:hypothetical protein